MLTVESAHHMEEFSARSLKAATQTANSTAFSKVRYHSNVYYAVSKRLSDTLSFFSIWQ